MEVIIKFLFIHLMPILFSVSVCSCSTLSRGQQALVITGKHPTSLSVRLNKDSARSNDRFKVIQISFTNKSDDWIRVKGFNILEENNSDVKFVPRGADLEAWKDSYLTKTGEYETDGFTLGLLGLSTVIGLAETINGNHDQATLTFQNIDEINEREEEKQLEQERKYLNDKRFLDQDSVFEGFVIAPGMHLSRWFVLHMKKNRPLSYIDFDILYKGTGEVSYRVDFG